MEPTTYVIGAILVAVVSVLILNFLPDFSVKCPKCYARMEEVGETHSLPVFHVVPEGTKLRCPQCGYSYTLYGRK